MLNRTFICLLALSCLLFTGCETNTTTSTSEWQPFEGQVVWVKSSRGFWAIQAKSIGKINPMSMPEEFKVNGLHIRGEVKLYPNANSARNWGTVGEIRSVSRIDG